MAYHFRKLKNTLRLLPSTKTMGFSTRLNEGDGHTSPTIAYTEDYSVASQQGFNDLISRSMKHQIRFDSSTTGSKSREGIARSQSNPELTSHFLPALISKTDSLLPLPVTYNDLAQILRLPVPLPVDKDLANDVKSVLRVVYPTSDDILVEITQGLNEFIPTNTALKDFIKCNLSSSEKSHATENTSPNFTRNNCTVNSSWSQQMQESTSLSDISSVAYSDHVQTFSSNSEPANNYESCNLFSATSTNNAEPPSSNSRSQQGKSSGNGGPSPEQMHKIKEKLEKAVCKLFSGRQDYSILHKNIVLENNLFGDNKTSVGMLAYAIEILKLRLRVHARFSNTSVELQSVTMLEQNGVIRIHWRLRGLSQIQTLKFWRIFQSKSPISKDDYEWVEAFSYFHIGKDGLVHKHRIDRMIPDDTSGTDKITNTLRQLLTPAKPLVS